MKVSPVSVEGYYKLNISVYTSFFRLNLLCQRWFGPAYLCIGIYVLETELTMDRRLSLCQPVPLRPRNES